jgi:hypothetical protein
MYVKIHSRLPLYRNDTKETPLRQIVEKDPSENKNENEKGN